MCFPVNFANFFQNIFFYRTPPNDCFCHIMIGYNDWIKSLDIMIVSFLLFPLRTRKKIIFIFITEAARGKKCSICSGAGSGRYRNCDRGKKSFEKLLFVAMLLLTISKITESFPNLFQSPWLFRKYRRNSQSDFFQRNILVVNCIFHEIMNLTKCCL